MWNKLILLVSTPVYKKFARKGGNPANPDKVRSGDGRADGLSRQPRHGRNHGVARLVSLCRPGVYGGRSLKSDPQKSGP